MKKIILSCATILSTLISAQDEKMGFVFELVRHGARAPLNEAYAQNFSVAVGQLTPEGMRQRYLLGRYARERYTQKYQLLNSDFTPGQVYIQSTNVNRTIQSGYSELLGIYPPTVAQEIKLTTGEQNSLSTGRGLPPMKLRDATAINAQLGESPLPNGFVSVPITTFVDYNIEDDVSYNGCDYALSAVNARRHSNAIYNDYWWLANFVRDPLAEALGVPYETMDQCSFYQVYDYSDAYVAMEFEGLPFVQENTFDENSYYEMRTMQKIELVGMFTMDTRRLAFSRVLRKPLIAMQTRVDELLGLTNGVSSQLRYAIYSGHDDQISNMMEWLHPNNYAMDYVLYASQVVFELKYDDVCLAQSASEDCFTVSVRYNGNELGFDACASSAQSDGTGCSYEDFKILMDGIWYSGVSAEDLNEACYQTYAPFGQKNLVK